MTDVQNKRFRSFLYFHIICIVQIGTHPTRFGDHNFHGTGLIHYSDISNTIISRKILFKHVYTLIYIRALIYIILIIYNILKLNNLYLVGNDQFGFPISTSWPRIYSFPTRNINRSLWNQGKVPLVVTELSVSSDG